MNVLFICIDTLRRDCLGTYRDRPVGFDYQVETPNFDRFADRAAVFDTHYASSLPTIPSRREYLTGIQEFLWRGWGSIEPFDTTIPEVTREAGIPSQLITDNYHHFENWSTHGYYEGFTGFELIRGHEGDAWKTTPREPDGTLLEQVSGGDPADVTDRRVQYARNVAGFKEEADFFAPRVFGATSDWLADNADWEQWFCMVDSFDVHEPFHCPAEYASMYTNEDLDDPDLPQWHQYGWTDNEYWTDRKLAFTRALYAGKVTMVDRWLGRVLDTLDEHGLWDDTMVIVTADHGHCLGDHGYVGKNEPPVYDVLARLPLLIWHPQSPRMGERIDALTQAVDLHTTILEAMGTSITDTGPGHSENLLPLLEGETDDHRDWGLYGWYGRSVNVTDGRYTYLRPSRPDGPLYEYTAIPPRDEERLGESDDFLPYTQYPVWRLSADPSPQNESAELYDVQSDPDQKNDIIDAEPEIEQRMRDLLIDAMETLEAPDEQYDRLKLGEFR